MDNRAFIEGTHHVIEPYGHSYNTYKWIGKKHWPVVISYYDVTAPSEIAELPWKLVLIKSDPYGEGKVYIRKDALIPIGWLIWLKVKLLDVWKWFYYRLIITANVWGLAYTRQGYIPSWKDLFKKK